MSKILTSEGLLTPVGRLLQLGEDNISWSADWLDYAAMVGIGPGDIDALIAVACDLELYRGDPASGEVWAPLHAWRALGQLRADKAVGPLLWLLKAEIDDHRIADELPHVFGMIGPAALPELAAFVLDRSLETFVAATALEGIREIGVRHRPFRAACVDALVQVLAPHPNGSPAINGFAIIALIDLKAAEAIGAVRAALARNAVDMSLAGDLEEVEMALGMRRRRVTPRPNWARLAGWAPMVQEKSRAEGQGRNDACPCGSGKKYKKCCLV